MIAAIAGPATALADDEPLKLATAECETDEDKSVDDLIKEATDHYERGLVLYEQGDYVGAIEEFTAGACARPHPSWYYNIGQTYERMTEFDLAVAHFEQFLREAESTDPNYSKARIRVIVLKKLPARITVATEPSGADVVILSDTGLASRGLADGKQQIEVLKGSYQMRIEMPGYEPIEQKITTEIGKPQSFYFKLTPIRAAVRITTDPDYARIFINRRLVGTGTYEGELELKDHELLIEAKNRPPLTETLHIESVEPLNLEKNLPSAPRSGRTELLIASTLGAALLGGAAATSIFGEADTASTVTVLGATAIGFGGAYLGIPDDVTVGTSSYFTGAAAIGAAEAALISLFAECDVDVFDCEDQLAGGIAAGTMAGILFAAVTQPRFKLRAGDAALINSGAIWGAATGALFFATFDSDQDIREPLIFAGLNLGIVTGATLAAKYDMSRKRVGLIDLSGVAGFVAGNALTRAFAGNAEAVDHFSIAGIGAGLIAGAYLTRKIDSPDEDALVPSIGAAKDSSGATTPTFGTTIRF